MRGPLLVAAIVVGAAAASAGPTLWAARDRGSISGQEAEPFFPPQEPLAVEILAASRRELRRLAGSESAVVDPPAVESGDRWVLSLYAPDDLPELPWVATLEGGVAQAVQVLWDDMPPAWRSPAALERTRLKLDHILPGERTFARDGGLRGVSLDTGVHGVVLRHPEGGEFRYLPSWPVERQVRRNRIHRAARKASRSRGGWRKEWSLEASYAAFRTRAWLEGRDGGAVPLARANTDIAGVDVDTLRAAIAEGAAYLTRETNARGRITYEFQAVTGERGKGYNMLRHAGTVYSMLQAWRLQHDDELMAAAQRAADYYISRLTEDPDHPGEYYVVDGKRAKLGGVGLGLLALTELEKARPGAVEMEYVYGLARHIERMQNPDGSFETFYPWDGEPVGERKSIYYSGEAILGLVHLHQLTGDDHWIDLAVAGADYLVHERWVGLGVRIYVPLDAWLTQALEEMDRVRPDEDRADYVFTIVAAIARNKMMDPEGLSPDLVGGDLSSLRKLPNVCTAGSFGEALSAGARLEARRRPGEQRVLGWALANAGFQLRNQYRPDNSYYLSDPDRARGGFRLEPDNGEVRNDYVQHNMSGLFGLLQLLDPSAPDIAWRVPPERRPPPLQDPS